MKYILMVILFSFISLDSFAKEKKKGLKPFKVNKKIEKKGDFVIIRTETIFTRSQWKELKNQTKENKSFLKNRKKNINKSKKPFFKLRGFLYF